MIGYGATMTANGETHDLDKLDTKSELLHKCQFTSGVGYLNAAESSRRPAQTTKHQFQPGRPNDESDRPRQD